MGKKKKVMMLLLTMLLLLVGACNAHAGMRTFTLNGKNYKIEQSETGYASTLYQQTASGWKKAASTSKGSLGFIGKYKSTAVFWGASPTKKNGSYLSLWTYKAGSKKLVRQGIYLVGQVRGRYVIGLEANASYDKGYRKASIFDIVSKKYKTISKASVPPVILSNKIYYTKYAKGYLYLMRCNLNGSRAKTLRKIKTGKVTFAEARFTTTYCDLSINRSGKTTRYYYK